MRQKPDTIELGIKIREARERSGLSLQALADKIHTYKSNLSKIEHGNANPTIGTLMAIFEVLGLEIKIIEK